MKPMTSIGAVLALAGILGLAIPVFTTWDTKQVASLGDLKIQSTEESSHTIPTPLSVGAMVLGVILIGAGTFKKADIVIDRARR